MNFFLNIYCDMEVQFKQNQKSYFFTYFPAKFIFKNVIYILSFIFAAI